MLSAFYFFILFLTPFHSSYAASDHSPFSHGTIYFNCENENLKKKSPNIQDVCITDKILSFSEITYFQALKEIYPDLQSNGSATRMSAIRIETPGQDESAKPGDVVKASQGEDFRLDKFSRTSLVYNLSQNANSIQLVILSDGGEKRPTLALFDLKPQLKLIDLVDVDFDRWVSMGNFLFTVKENSPFFFLVDSHHNSSQWYVRNSSWIILNQKLHLVYDGPDLSGQRMESQDCRTQAEIKKIKPLATQHAGFVDISLELSRSKICTNQKTGKDIRLHEKIYPAILIWDADKNKYKGGSKSFVKENSFQP